MGPVHMIQKVGSLWVQGPTIVLPLLLLGGEVEVLSRGPGSPSSRNETHSHRGLLVQTGERERQLRPVLNLESDGNNVKEGLLLESDGNNERKVGLVLTRGFNVSFLRVGHRYVHVSM